MTVLRKLEETLRAALEGPFAHLFPQQLHPLEVAGQLRPAMAASRLLTPDGSFVRNLYLVRLSLPDYETLSAAIPAMEREMGEHLEQYAALEGFLAGEHVTVQVAPDDHLARGRIAVEAQFAPRPKAWVEIESGAANFGRRFDLGELTVLGRSEDCQVQVVEGAVSRHHAEITWLYLQYLLRDLDSANGSFTNGQPVSRAFLRDGDLIELGLAQLRFRQPAGARQNPVST